jgi:hypothetical protein
MSTAAKRKDATSPPKTLRELGLENYHVVEIHRSELVNAVYNPRKISDHEKSKLREVLKRHGLVAPITWNHRSKNIVGGHQRIGLLDDIAETSDYTLHVAVIDVDEAREKELNIERRPRASISLYSFSHPGPMSISSSSKRAWIRTAIRMARRSPTS